MPDGLGDTPALIDLGDTILRMNLQQNSRTCFHFLSQGLIVHFFFSRMVGDPRSFQNWFGSSAFFIFSSTDFYCLTRHYISR